MAKFHYASWFASWSATADQLANQLARWYECYSLSYPNSLGSDTSSILHCLSLLHQVSIGYNTVYT